MHEWYLALADDDREMLHEVIREAADHAVFGMLCLLDNVRPVLDGYSEELELRSTSNGVSSPILADAEEFHPLFRGRVDNESGFDS